MATEYSSAPSEHAALQTRTEELAAGTSLGKTAPYRQMHETRHRLACTEHIAQQGQQKQEGSNKRRYRVSRQSQHDLRTPRGHQQRLAGLDGYPPELVRGAPHHERLPHKIMITYGSSANRHDDIGTATCVERLQQRRQRVWRDRGQVGRAGNASQHRGNHRSVACYKLVFFALSLRIDQLVARLHDGDPRLPANGKSGVAAEQRQSDSSRRDPASGAKKVAAVLEIAVHTPDERFGRIGRSIGKEHILSVCAANLARPDSVRADRNKGSRRNLHSLVCE